MRRLTANGYGADPLADRAAFQDAKMSRHRLAATPRLHSDLYCLPSRSEPGGPRPPRPGQALRRNRGKARIRVGPEIEWLEPGVLVVAPAGIEHGLENPTPEPCVVLVVVVPPPSRMRGRNVGGA